MPCDEEPDWEDQRKKIIGLGELSIRKSYYPELQEQQEALIESETMLRSILDGSPVLQFVIDPHHLVISWNRAIEKYSGIRAADIVGTDGHWRAFYPEKRPLLADVLLDGSIDLLPSLYGDTFRRSQFIDEGYEVINFFPNMGDSGKWLHGIATPVRDAQGAIIGAVETLQDITNRKQAEDALRESEARLIMAQEIGHIGSWEYDLKTERVWGSAESVRLFGLKEGGGVFPIEAIEACIPERERVHQALVDLIETDKEYCLEYAITPADGTPQRILMSMARLERDASGGPHRVVGVIQDITTRMRALEAKRENEKFLNSVVENIPHMIFVKDARDLQFVRFNKAGEELLGYTRQELQGKTDYDFFPKDEADFFTEKDRAVLEKRQIVDIPEEKIRTRFKGERILHTKKIPIPDETGHPNYLMGISEDITERKRTEEALKLARNKMNLLNAVTFQDIQTAAFSLTAYLTLMKTFVTDEKGKTFLDKQLSAHQKILDSLIFAKNYQDMGIKPPRWQNVDQVFLMAISHLDLLQLTRNHRIEGLEIYADPLLETVFFHMVQNVLRHGLHATEITTRYQEKQDALVLFIEDNGAGVPAAEKHMIFDRSYGKNAGLGLFLVREVLSITEIGIKETGEPGKGARFEITVPKGGYRFTETHG
jgi:PAS domain S-box-containing protein